MAVVTTRRLDQLQAQCRELGVEVPEGASREQLFDLLRRAVGSGDVSMELDPMKARDLNKEIDWRSDRPFKPLSRFFTTAYAMEPKYDGVRLRVWFGDEQNTINSGRRSVKTFQYSRREDRFPHLRDAVVPELVGTVLDGELLAPGPVIQTHTGNWTNSLLNASVALVNGNAEGSKATQERFGPAVFHAFDIMYMNGESVMEVPYWRRRELLEKVVRKVRDVHPHCHIGLVPSELATEGEIKRQIELGYEGVVIKQRTSSHVPGARNGGWFKVKVSSTADAFICGYNPGENANEGQVGSLNLAVYRLADPVERAVVGGQKVERGGEIYIEQPVAQVGNLTAELRAELTAEDGSLKEEWYGRVVEFKAQGIGKNGRARHANLVRLRPDKEAIECLEDQLDVFVRC